jgi:hypothetical protein
MKPKTCKNKHCKAKFSPFKSTDKVCSVNCAIEYAKIKVAKENKAKQAIELKELKAKVKSRTDWLNEAQVVFNRWIRKRDANQPCISCGKPLKAGNIDAGHYYSAFAHSALRLNEDNVHSQCSRPCNKDKSGDLINYREGLIKRIGEERIALLEYHSKLQKKWEIDELKELISHYKK